MSILSLAWWLVVGHAVADFVLQLDSMARGKNRHRRTDPPPGAVFTPTWVYWLSAHALTHGGTVALVTGSLELGVAEAALHWVIDFGKCENFYGVHVDQAAHLVCKALWLGVVMGWPR